MKHIFFLFYFFLLLSCSDHPVPSRTDGFTRVLNTKEDSLLQEVMDGHDAGMARMGKLSKYQKRVLQAIDSVNKRPSTKRDQDYLNQLLKLKEELSYAENSMNVWMEGFKMDSAKENTQLRLQYLAKEREKITKVKAAILSSLVKADSLFIK